MSIQNFRRGVTSQQHQQQRGRGGGGAGRFVSWRQRLDLPKGTAASVPVVFIDAEYDDIYATDDHTKQLIEPPPKRPYHHSKNHKCMFGPKGSRNPADYGDFPCSAGRQPYQPKPCIGCYYADRKVKSISFARDFYRMNTALLLPFHRVPAVGKDGQFLKRKDAQGNPTEEYLYNEEPCTLQGCQYCTQNAQYQQRGERIPFEIQLGAHRYMEVGTGHLQNLLDLDTLVSNKCADCRTTIVRTGYRCMHCKAPMLDIATQAQGWSKQQLDAFGQNDYQCQNCHQVGQPEEVGVCGYDPSGFNRIGGCPQGKEARRLTLFDCVFYLRKTGEDQQTRITCEHWVPKSEFRFNNGQTVEDTLKLVAEKPFDFDKMSVPLPLEKQAEKARQPIPPEYLGAAQPGYGQPPPGYGQPGAGYAPQPGAIPPQPGAAAYGQPQQAPYPQPGYPQQQPQPGYPQQQPQQPYAQPYQNVPVPGKPQY